jgi:hypothetical protein
MGLGLSLDRAETDAGLAEKPFCLADAAGHRAVGVSQPRALDVLSGERVRAFATVSPAIPAPITTTRSTGPATPAGTSARPSSKLSAVNPATPSAKCPMLSLTHPRRPFGINP